MIIICLKERGHPARGRGGSALPRMGARSSASGGGRRRDGHGRERRRSPARHLEPEVRVVGANPQWAKLKRPSRGLLRQIRGQSCVCVRERERERERERASRRAESGLGVGLSRLTSKMDDMQRWPREAPGPGSTTAPAIGPRPGPRLGWPGTYCWWPVGPCPAPSLSWARGGRQCWQPLADPRLLL